MEVPVCQGKPCTANRIRYCKTNVSKHGFVEGLKRFVFIVNSRRFDFFQYIGVTTHRTLTEYHHVTRQNVCPFHSNGNRHALIASTQIVIWTKHDPFTTVNIHRVVNNGARAFGQMIFTNRRNNRRLLT